MQDFAHQPYGSLVYRERLRILKERAPKRVPFNVPIKVPYKGGSCKGS